MLEMKESLLEERSEMLKVLAHPIRLNLVRYLMHNGAQNVSQLQKVLDIPQPSVSSHLGKLKRAHILESRRKGTEIFYDVDSTFVIDLVEVIFHA
ncbi:metalloregulator ArsR/SmtB family transcription factor [Peptoniphilus equinus]|uniref:Metalloregulator ArsR/SmtB family transcription factor n=1 Tax=Peptoniphilus equinus TaxID=3016343 RepID=A0ABY7QUJ0_9FIRM|nr:metalloregulator ArsR/SmtB family transcription factor [Peptoniphilus equinus]WBW50450.1 metalloregulator ArsR/SmtB family transcription factor [Peptoniphilus equinus]